jgi:carbon storage regulator CsrA
MGLDAQQGSRQNVDPDPANAHVSICSLRFLSRGLVMQSFLRGVNESLVIGHDVVVTVLEINASWIRLSIEDPRSAPSYREETLYMDAGDDGGDEFGVGDQVQSQMVPSEVEAEADVSWRSWTRQGVA